MNLVSSVDLTGQSLELSDPIGIGLFGRIREWVDRQPDKPLYVFLSARGDVTARFTYRQFNERVSVIASHLALTPGLVPGDRLVLLYSPGIEMICALFACARAGFIGVPAAPVTSHGFDSQTNQLKHIVTDSRARAILMDADIRHLLTDNLGDDGAESQSSPDDTLFRPLWIETERLTHRLEGAPDRPPNEIFCLQYTSGSTNDPKGVIVTHKGLLHNCDLVADYETPITVSWLPQHHDMGLIGYYIYTLLGGGTTYGFSPVTFIQRPVLWLETISKYGAIASSAPNFAFDLCLDERRVPHNVLDDLDLSSLKFLMAAAEPIKVDTYRRFVEKFERCGLDRRSYFVAYGLAEFTLAVTNHGRNFLRLNKTQLAAGIAQPISSASQIRDATQLMSCGRPLGDTVVKIVDDDNEPLPEDRVGEIWIAGQSACRGYWSKPVQTAETFRAQLADSGFRPARFIRTGDMGFKHDGELYVCGRRKDMIIVRGQNHYAEDVEDVVQRSYPQLRTGGLAAFEIEGNEGSQVALVAEVGRSRPRPDPRDIIRAVRERLNVTLVRITFVPPRSVLRTSSGKVRRSKTRELLLAGALNVLDDFQTDASELATVEDEDRNELSRLKKRYNLTGDEDFTLLDAGIDSFDVVVFLHWLREKLDERGALISSDEIDTKLLGAVTIRQISQIETLLEIDPEAAMSEMRRFLDEQYAEHLRQERQMMLADRALRFEPEKQATNHEFGPAKSILLTGGTGFLGPFLLASLMRQTDARIHVLVRARDQAEAANRIRTGLAAAIGKRAETLNIADRVVLYCGDLELPNLGLTREVWVELADELDTIYHNAASVNYLLDYRRMRPANVFGVNEVLKLAFAGIPKQFNQISTTFMYGWAQKDVLYEDDNNDDMSLLDFGYSQSKWVSEQLVHDASRKGLAVRVFRPSLMTPSVEGGGETMDITLRFLSFIIKHGISVSARNQVSFVPADVAASNIVAIANDAASVGGVFNVTRDEYENLVDVAELITSKTGRRFEMFNIKEFVPEVIRRCTTEDPLYPLLDFLIDSVDKIDAMADKRYDNRAYRSARSANANAIVDPTLSDVVDGILRFFDRP